MVTTDEDNVVRGTITESDRLGNVRTYVEVGVERVESVVTGSNRSKLWPILLVVATYIGLITGLPGTTLLAGVALLFLLVWVVER